MPIYEYLCDKCNEKSSIHHSLKEKPTQCPLCEAENSLEKIFSMPRVVKHNTAGTIVKAHIEEAKEDLKKEIEKIKKEEYKK